MEFGEVGWNPSFVFFLLLKIGNAGRNRWRDGFEELGAVRSGLDRWRHRRATGESLRVSEGWSEPQKHLRSISEASSNEPLEKNVNMISRISKNLQKYLKNPQESSRIVKELPIESQKIFHMILKNLVSISQMFHLLPPYLPPLLTSLPSCHLISLTFNPEILKVSKENLRKVLDNGLVKRVQHFPLVSPLLLLLLLLLLLPTTPPSSPPHTSFLTQSMRC